MAGRVDRALHLAVRAEDTRTGPSTGDSSGIRSGSRWGHLELGRQGDPQLESRTLRLRCAGVPDAVARPHPLDASGRQHAGLPVVSA